MIPIKRRCNFLIDKEKGKVDGRLRYRISWNNSKDIVNFNVGYRVEYDKWSKDTQRCKNNTTHGEYRVSAYEINRAIQVMEEDIESIFYKYEMSESIPMKKEIRDDYNKLVGNTPDSNEKKTLLDVYNDFIKDQSIKSAWSSSQIKRSNVIKNHIKRWKSDIKLQDINEDTLQGFVDHFIYKVKIRNTTIDKHYRYFVTFLRWCEKKGLINPEQYVYFKPKLKGLNTKEVIYLEWEELMKLLHFDFKSSTHIKVRDVFCFCCFTGLRYSDVAKLGKEDVHKDYIEIVTKKTTDRLIIDLNKYSQALIDKYKDYKGPKVFPVISNQKMNRYLKEICKVAEIDTPIKITYFVGNKVFEEVKPKHKLIGTHCGRRTFVVNALTLGISPHVIMKWTGHKSMEAMKPYTKIVDKLKRSEMDKFNR
mgnify:CR=1 FL=1